VPSPRVTIPRRDRLRFAGRRYRSLRPHAAWPMRWRQGGRRQEPAEGIVALIGDSRLATARQPGTVISAAPEIAALVSGCPELRIITTSRTLLRIEAERGYASARWRCRNRRRLKVRSRSCLSGHRLFVERAKVARSSFELTADNAPAVVAMCRRWMACRRHRTRGCPDTLLSPESLLQRLDHASTS